MRPTVSICVPNLNTRPFLPDRFQTILDQSFQDWELLVYDSYSTDGAWDYFGELAAREPRMRIWQGPREGAPASWNPCIREARGEYVYVATSDDTMPADCLEKLVAALEANPDCDIAHCPLRAIDEHGRDVAEVSRWWSEHSVFAESSGPLLHQPHVRRAPFDGMLHLLGGAVYISITQLLIRRALFDQIGMFESQWGSVSDFNWEMRAGLVANTIHVPDTWGGWRLHAAQATAGAAIGSPAHARKVDSMIDHAIDVSLDRVNPAIRRFLSQWKREAEEHRAYERDLDGRSRWRRFGLGAVRTLAGSAAAREHITRRLCGRPRSHWVGRRLNGAGLDPAFAPPLARLARVPEHLHPSSRQWA